MLQLRVALIENGIDRVADVVQHIVDMKYTNVWCGYRIYEKLIGILFASINYFGWKLLRKFYEYLFIFDCLRISNNIINIHVVLYINTLHIYAIYLTL